MKQMAQLSARVKMDLKSLKIPAVSLVQNPYTPSHL
jgi:hypothetical protein